MALDVIDISAEGLAAYVVAEMPHRKSAVRRCRPSRQNRPPFNGLWGFFATTGAKSAGIRRLTLV